jgi:serine/threonine protein kinase/formylglycine-generating enzyme required for sulfatase activity
MHHEETRPLEPPSEQPPPAPESIGPYRILGVLGEGGMGIVYVAEQKHPIRRRVALKIIKLGMDSKQVVLRFEAERQALAMMEHDTIAKVFEAGTTESGQPYFAMEHVPGLPITEYCDRQQLSTEERLRIFQRVCAGVQHAHQKGIIHRDLKPNNVLVTEHQGQPVPKIIDFGIAKATDHRLTEATLFTSQGQIVGTPEYMSPEQAEMTSADIDTRTDVYSLGVLLYELLVGELPFSSQELRRAGLLEIHRKIREDEPPRPSTKLTSLGDDSTRRAEQRKTSLASLVRELRGDLDWVVMRAMEKERNRRYPTAVGLAEDIERYLAHQPVVAGPPGAAYQIKKFVRRYRTQVVTTSIIFLSLLGGIVGTTHFMFEARTQTQLAQDNELFAQEKAQEAQENADKFAKKLNEYNLLANVVNLREAKIEETRLFPAWPEETDAMRSWITDRAEPLEANLPELVQTLEELRIRAVEPTREEQENRIRSHPRFSELETLRDRLRALEAAQEVRSGQATSQAFPMDASTIEDASTLNQMAWPLVSWREGQRTWGREAEGLALARRAWEQMGSQADPELRAPVADTLAWALFANGLDQEAIAMSQTAFEAAAEHKKQDYRDAMARLIGAVTAAGSEQLAAVARSVRELEAEVSERKQWRFAEQADQFLHNTLVTLVDDIQAFVAPEDGELARVRDRLQWSMTVHESSIGSHIRAWDQAQLAILRANGRTASERYGNSAIRLAPQLGLVPIGMNPKTGLWEFYHLRSAANPQIIPTHDEEGNIEVTAETGIIFVLIPGGTFVMGAQQDDPAGPNFDPLADPNETPRRVTVAPFFLARHELTQGQWRRLSVGETPSQYGPGLPVGGMSVTLSHPVEQLSWEACYALLSQHSLEIPREAQWEFACRAGTNTPWSTGVEAVSLATSANILDQTGARAAPSWGTPEAFDDGFAIHAPVGSFQPNGYGLYDMHGNIYEWCQDLYDSDSSTHRVVRGGSFTLSARSARSAYRDNYAPTVQISYLGVRPTRALR